MGRALRGAGLGGFRRLTHLLERFGEAIEADLFERGFDLAVLWRRRRFRFLLNIIRHLPRNSHYADAVANDEDLVLAQWDQIAQQNGKQATGPRVSEHGYVEELLADICDRLGGVISALQSVNGIKPKPIKPLSRPRTAVDRIKARKARESRLALVEKLTPQHLDLVRNSMPKEG